jgi:hypothetical protein
MWSELQGNISREALSYLVDEVCRADVIETDKARCGCLLMSTMDLPCRTNSSRVFGNLFSVRGCASV